MTSSGTPERIAMELVEKWRLGPRFEHWVSLIECQVATALKDYGDERFSDAIEKAANILGQYLTYHHHRFDGGVNLCESSYGAPDSQCVIEVIRSLRSGKEK